MRTLTKVAMAAAAAGTAAYAGWVGTAWRRYGRVDRDAPGDVLLDRFMRRYEVRERHERRVEAPASLTFARAKEASLRRSPLTRTIFAVRSMDARDRHRRRITVALPALLGFALPGDSRDPARDAARRGRGGRSHLRARAGSAGAARRCHVHEAVMGGRGDGHGLIHVGGDHAALVDRMRAPLLKALSGRRRFYAVRIEALGPGGDVLVSITGSKGRVPLLFGPDELQEGHVSSVVRGVLDRAAF